MAATRACVRCYNCRVMMMSVARRVCVGSFFSSFFKFFVSRRESLLVFQARRGSSFLRPRLPLRTAAVRPIQKAVPPCASLAFTTRCLPSVFLHVRDLFPLTYRLYVTPCLHPASHAPPLPSLVPLLALRSAASATATRSAEAFISTHIHKPLSALILCMLCCVR